MYLVVLWRSRLQGSAIAQELTNTVVDFVVCDWRPVNAVDSMRFLHLIEVAEPRHTVPCHPTVNSYIDKR